jgi:hypothetical protein
MKVLADAIKRAGTTEEPQLKDAIAATSNFAGVTGNISLDKDRNAVKPAVVLKLQDKKYIYVETIYPEGMTAPATAVTPVTAVSPASSNASPAAAPASSPAKAATTATPAKAASPAATHTATPR